MTGGNCAVCKVVGVLTGVGALNWGLVALFGLDLVAKALGSMTTPAKAVYVLIGLAGLMQLVSFVKACPCCSGGSCGSKK